jgi:AdoMet-dependent heme synthase
MFDVDYDRAPLLVIWEVTRGCALSCRHCRAATWDFTDPDELTLDEGRRLLDDVAAMGTPVVVFTGGDPLRRDDLEALIAHARSLGLRTGAIPATSARLTRERLASLKEAGLDQLALSIDAPTRAEHDGFRRVDGCFDKAMEAAGWARELGLALQINTVFARWNASRYADLAALVESLGVVFWEVFFLVPVGRGTEMEGCTDAEMETLFAQLAETSRRVDFVVKVTEAPQYRVHMAKSAGAGAPRMQANESAPLPSAHHAVGGGIRRDRRGINAGKGFCFVDHHGRVMPSGFLPVEVGSVRERSIAEIYREAPLMLALRDPTRLEGGCGLCSWRELCGGSRARAYAATGNAFAAEPSCALARRLEAAPPRVATA